MKKAAAKVLTKKKPPKKLTKSSELFPSIKSAGTSAGASNKAPGPKKAATTVSKKHKKSETQSESEKPVKKKTKHVFESDSSEDFQASSPPPLAPRAKKGFFITFSFQFSKSLLFKEEGPSPSATRTRIMIS